VGGTKRGKVNEPHQRPTLVLIAATSDSSALKRASVALHHVDSFVEAQVKPFLLTWKANIASAAPTTPTRIQTASCNMAVVLSVWWVMGGGRLHGEGCVG